MRNPFRPHEHWRQLADRVADGSAGPRDREKLGQHIAGCPPCSDLLARTVALRAALHGMPDIATPRSFAISPEMLAAGQDAAPQRVRQSPPRFALRTAQAMTAAGALALGALLAAGLVDSGSDTDTAALTASSADDGGAERAARTAGSQAGSQAGGSGAAGEASTAMTDQAAGTLAASGTPAAATMAPDGLAGGATPVPPSTGIGPTPVPSATALVPVPPRTGPGQPLTPTPGDVGAAAVPQATEASAYSTAGTETPKDSAAPLPEGSPGVPATGQREEAFGDAGGESPNSAIGGPAAIGLAADDDDDGRWLQIAQVVAGVLFAGSLTAWLALKFQPRRS